MSICKSIFQKEIFELKIEDIIDYFKSPQEETAILEFKSGEIEIDAIYKEVSAFLNIDGGILIIGSPREILDPEKKVKICKGDLVPSKKITSRDILIRSIASNISPSPSHINAMDFHYKDGMIYIIEIPQSMNPPHQVSNEGKYYIRLDREARPAPHGIVEALFNRRQKPVLSAEILALYPTESKKSFGLSFTISNESLITAEKIGYMITLYGVGLHDIIEKLNMPLEFTSRNDFINYQHISESFLVKGLSMTISFEMLPIPKLLYFIFEYWSMHGQLQTRAILVEIIDGKDKLIGSFDSKLTDNKYSIEELFEQYQAKQKE